MVNFMRFESSLWDLKPAIAAIWAVKKVSLKVPYGI